jgi:hypothetical protein
MEVNIEDVVSTIRAVDGDSVLSPKTMEKIVRTVLEAVHQREQHRKRVQTERKVTGGVQEEQEQGD